MIFSNTFIYIMHFSKYNKYYYFIFFTALDVHDFSKIIFLTMRDMIDLSAVGIIDFPLHNKCTWKAVRQQ